MGGTVATKSDEVLGKLFEMINTGNFSFWFHSKSPITVDNLYKDGGLFKNTEIDETKKGRQAAYDSLLEFGFGHEDTLKALESVNWDLERASLVLLQ